MGKIEPGRLPISVHSSAYGVSPMSSAAGRDCGDPFNHIATAANNHGLQSRYPGCWVCVTPAGASNPTDIGNAMHSHFLGKPWLLGCHRGLLSETCWPVHLHWPGGGVLGISWRKLDLTEPGVSLTTQGPMHPGSQANHSPPTHRHAAPRCDHFGVPTSLSWRVYRPLAPCRKRRKDSRRAAMVSGSTRHLRNPASPRCYLPERPRLWSAASIRWPPPLICVRERVAAHVAWPARAWTAILPFPATIS